MVKFESTFDEKVTRELNVQTFKKMWWLFLLASALLIMLGILNVVDGESVGFGIFFIAFGVLFTPLVILLTAILQKSVNKSMSILSSSTTESYEFTEDKIIIMQNKGDEYIARTETTYNYLFKVRETKESYIMYISRMQAHVVFKDKLIEGSIEELNTLLAEKLGKKFTAKKSV